MLQMAVNKELSDEVMAEWRVDAAKFATSFGVQPTATNSDISLIASGVDGRTRGCIRRYLGHVLLEDLKRVPMRADTWLTSEATGNPGQYRGVTANTQRLRASPKRVYNMIASGRAVIEQMFPFEISRHSGTAEIKYIRGFVLRIRQVFNIGVPEAEGAPIDFAGGLNRPFVAILIIDEQEVAPLDGTDSRFRFVVPLIPVSRTCSIDRRQQPHYADGSFPSFTPNDGGPPTTPIFCNDPIRICSTERFLYVFSQTGEFYPVTIWNDPNYGDSTNPDGVPPFLLSKRSPGWHWEQFGHILQKPTNPSHISGDTGPGLSLAKTYQVAYQFIDPYRFRWSPLSNRIAATLLANKDFPFSGEHYTSPGYQVESICHFPAYRFYGTLGADRIGGSLRFADYMTCPYYAYPNRPTMLGYALAGTYDPFKVRHINTTRDDTTYFPPGVFYDLSNATDDALAVGEIYDAVNLDPAIYPPVNVFGGIHLQGVTLALTDKVPSSLESTSSTTDLSTGLVPVASGHALLRWSCTSAYGPEMFPAVNSFRTKLSTSQAMMLLQVGDYGFALGDGQVIRIQRVSYGVEIIELLTGLALVSSQAACSVRGMLFGVFRDGAYVIDPATGNPTKVELLDRLIRDIWADTLGSIWVDYDQSLNAIFILNATTGSIAILWLDTQQVTVLEQTPYRQVTSQVFGSTRRAVLVSNTGRFVVPRLYANEDSDGSLTMLGITTPNGILGKPYRQYSVLIDTASYDPSIQGTKITTRPNGTEDPRDIQKMFIREGFSSPIEEDAVTHLDRYYYGMKLYGLGTSNYGTQYTVKGTQYAPSTPFRLVLEGDVTGQLTTGDRLSISPVPFGVVFGPLESEPGRVNGTQKRIVQNMNVVVPWYSFEEQPSDVPFMELGVIDYESLRATEPMGIASTFWRCGITDTEKDRRGFVPSTGNTYSPNDPTVLFTAFTANGTYLFPYIRCFTSHNNFDLTELTITGTISPSKAAN